ncbi:MAG: Clp protease N-terminal domain-containing protein, partial [Pseudomonadota bacterium]
MDLEKFTERARGFLQNAQTLASRSQHQQLTPLHLLRVLLDDREGLAAGLIERAGGNARAAADAVAAELQKLPRVEGGGAGQV